MPRCPLSRPSYLYINSKAPKELADFLAKQFAVRLSARQDGERVRMGGTTGLDWERGTVRPMWGP